MNANDWATLISDVITALGILATYLKTRSVGNAVKSQNQAPKS